MSARRLLSVCLLALIVAGCTTADYSSGITQFSGATTTASTAEQSLATASQQAQLAEWSKAALKLPASDTTADLVKCDATQGYKPGDCVVVTTALGPAPTKLESASLAGINKYASTLNSVATDQSCSTIQADAKSVSASVSDLAKVAQASGLATDAGPISTIASTIACVVIDNAKLSVLRKATQAANPIIQSLAQVIAKKDAGMERIVVRDKAAALDASLASYQQAPNAGTLGAVVAAAQAVDAAQSTKVDQLVSDIAKVHQTLTDQLKAPKVNMSIVFNDAQSLLSDAQTIQTAAAALDPANSASKTTK